jgi:hypothetical protein
MTPIQDLLSSNYGVWTPNIWKSSLGNMDEQNSIYRYNLVVFGHLVTKSRVTLPKSVGLADYRATRT